MFCKNCGSKINEDAKFCKNCGYEIKKGQKQNACEKIEDKEKYLYFKKVKNRETIKKILNYVEKAYVVILFLLTVTFIYEEYNAQEGYKLVLYIIRYLTNFSPLILFGGYVEVFKDLFGYKESDLNNKKQYTREIIFGLNLLSLALITFALWDFVIPSNANALKWFTAVSFGEIGDIISCFSLNIICVVASGIARAISDKNLNIEN